VLAVLEPFHKATTKKHAPKGYKNKPLPLPPTLLSLVLRRCVDEGLWEVAGALVKGGHVSSLALCPSLLEALLAARRLDLAEKLLRQLRDVPQAALQAALKAALPPNDRTDAIRAALAPLAVSAKAAVRFWSSALSR
jgi:hypothetical protein